MKNREALREKQVNLRLTQAEYERLTRTAQNHGIGRAAYLRMVLRGVWLLGGRNDFFLGKVMLNSLLQCSFVWHEPAAQNKNTISMQHHCENETAIQKLNLQA